MDEGRIYVRVTGKGISKEELEIYFKSRKQSGGGEISSIEQINDEESIITFEDKEGKLFYLSPPFTLMFGRMVYQTVKLSSYANKDIETASNCSLSLFFVGFRFHFGVRFLHKFVPHFYTLLRLFSFLASKCVSS